MIVITAAIFGALLGAFRARHHGGNRLDMLQWGGSFAIAFALIGLIATIVIERQF